jgi:hypothetical protein
MLSVLKIANAGIIEWDQWISLEWEEYQMKNKVLLESI